MNNILLGIISGVIFGLIDVGLMLPLSFPDKPAALLGAFTSRLAIGFVIATTVLPVAPWQRGLIFGILLSVPDAIITKSWLPILTTGAVGGILIGWVVGRWGTW
jgi:hypothetical protein